MRSADKLDMSWGCAKMIDMARQPKKRTGSRHLDRHMVSLPGDLYDWLQVAADRAGRPLSWEVRMRLVKSLEADKTPKPSPPGSN